MPDEIPSAEYYFRLFSYNKKILDRYLRSLSRLPWKTVSKNFECSHYSMKETYVHILTVYNGWLNYCIHGRYNEIPFETEHNPKNYHSIGDLQNFKKKVWKGVEKLLSVLDERYLRKKVSAPWLPGSYMLADVLMQVSFEQAHHIGEIIAMFWQIGTEPPEMTWLMTSRKRV